MTNCSPTLQSGVLYIMLPLWFWEDLVFGACRHTSTYSGQRPHPCQAAKLLSCMSPEPLCTQHLALPSAKVAEPNTPCFPPSLRCGAAADLFICINSFCCALSAIPSSGFATVKIFQHCIALKTWSHQTLFRSQAFMSCRSAACLIHLTT